MSKWLVTYNDYLGNVYDLKDNNYKTSSIIIKCEHDSPTEKELRKAGCLTGNRSIIFTQRLYSDE